MARHDAINWTAELEANVLDSIESGMTLRKAARVCDISDSAIIRHVIANQEFAKQYARVMEDRTDADFEGLFEEIAQEPAKNDFGIDSAWVAWQRVRIDTIKWALSKRNPKKYGERMALTANDGGPLKLVVEHIAGQAELKSANPPLLEGEKE